MALNPFCLFSKTSYKLRLIEFVNCRVSYNKYELVVRTFWSFHLVSFGIIQHSKNAPLPESILLIPLKCEASIDISCAIVFNTYKLLVTPE